MSPLNLVLHVNMNETTGNASVFSLSKIFANANFLLLLLIFFFFYF